MARTRQTARKIYRPGNPQTLSRGTPSTFWNSFHISHRLPPTVPMRLNGSAYLTFDRDTSTVPDFGYSPVVSNDIVLLILEKLDHSLLLNVARYVSKDWWYGVWSTIKRFSFDAYRYWAANVKKGVLGDYLERMRELMIEEVVFVPVLFHSMKLMIWTYQWDIGIDFEFAQEDEVLTELDFELGASKFGGYGHFPDCYYTEQGVTGYYSEIDLQVERLTGLTIAYQVEDSSTDLDYNPDQTELIISPNKEIPDRLRVKYHSNAFYDDDDINPNIEMQINLSDIVVNDIKCFLPSKGYLFLSEDNVIYGSVQAYLRYNLPKGYDDESYRKYKQSEREEKRGIRSVIPRFDSRRITRFFPSLNGPLCKIELVYDQEDNTWESKLYDCGRYSHYDEPPISSDYLQIAEFSVDHYGGRTRFVSILAKPHELQRLGSSRSPLERHAVCDILQGRNDESIFFIEEH